MKRLNQGDRDALRRQLLDALLPDRADELRALEHAAFHAVVRDFFTPNGLRRIGGLPLAWLTRVDRVLCKPSGHAYWQAVHAPEVMLPRCPPDDRPLSEAAQAAVDRWWTTKTEVADAKRALTYQLDRLLAAATTLEALLQRLPEARDILKLPPAESVDAIAEDVRAQLIAKGGGQ